MGQLTYEQGTPTNYTGSTSSKAHNSKISHKKALTAYEEISIQDYERNSIS